ncbi:MAG: HemK/PrmC family methyltransferase [Candidatus Limnocylindria bacterium]
MPPADAFGSLVAAAAERLQASGSPSARLDAEVLVAHVVERDRSWVLAHPDDMLDADSVDRLRTAVDRRVAGEPIAYIRGFRDWQSLRIRTDNRALIPRPETELLAEAAIAELELRLARNGQPIVAWEVATGTGAVTLAVALRFRQVIRLGRIRLIASDLSPDALELAEENLADHRATDLVSLACADLLEPAGVSLPLPDLVIANLPYVASADVDAREDSLGFEPRMALDGGADGLGVLRSLLADLPSRAAPRATILLEIGVGQATEIAALGPAGAAFGVVPDLAGLDRVVRIDLRD